MTSDPEESVRLLGYGEMTLRTAITTVMLLAPREHSNAVILRVRDETTLTPGEIAELASQWGIPGTANSRKPVLDADKHWPNIVRGMVREAPLPALMVAFMLGVLVARR